MDAYLLFPSLSSVNLLITSIIDDILNWIVDFSCFVFWILLLVLVLTMISLDLYVNSRPTAIDAFLGEPRQLLDRGTTAVARPQGDK